jgi:hypothetical protein
MSFTTSASGPARARHSGHGSRRATGDSHWRGGLHSGRSSPANANGADSGRWDRGGHHGSTRGRGRGRGTKPNLSWRKGDVASAPATDESDAGGDEVMDEVEAEEAEEGAAVEVEEPVLETPEDKERYWKQVRPIVVHL